MQAGEQKKREEFLEKNDVFRKKAFLIISEMLEMKNQITEDTSVLVDEVLHSIFFLGKICFPPFSPEMIFEDIVMYDELKMDYPRPFELYSSQLPRRSPLSCVLDMIVHLERPENELQIKGKLQELMGKLRKVDTSKILSSSTVCVSHTNTLKSVRFYGVSMSMFGRLSGKIMVAASCCSYWDDYVADAVMTYCPDKKQYFDGTIKLPEDVRCQAFNISEGTEKKPCPSCGVLFGLHPTEGNPWPYGNCAEVESLSNLFKNDREVKIAATPQSPLWTNEGRQRARDALLTQLRKCWLNAVEFEWDGDFYTSEHLQ